MNEENKNINNEEKIEEVETEELDGEHTIFHKSGFYGKTWEKSFETDNPKIVITSLAIIWLIAMVVGIIFIVKFFSNGENNSAYIAIGVLLFVTCCICNQVRLNIKRNKNK